MKLWFIADTHFGHENIIQYENRPFDSVQEMDEVIIRNWNKNIGKYDKVYFFGDVSFYNKEKTKVIIGQLNGFKILIKGNHDKKSNEFWLECGFKEVSKYPIVLTQYGIILSHEPINVDLLDGFFNYHGHIHTKTENFEGKYPDKYKCCSVECLDYTPFLFKDNKQGGNHYDHRKIR